ncbi:DUF2127 domain-containing protein [Granulicella cerasi]|uniref:DUF2127 domain-containing protein n=1 Tax=Granulicella cerasi TaxID=741063 RepID=A0ABW1ZBR2_9BACT|nr:DUF2127 domain-containing protein [Granulicella cerasi]
MGSLTHPEPVATPTHPGVDHHDRGLLLVALFKLAKALFFVGVGVGALHLVHRDVGEVAMRVASLFRLDTEGPVVRFMLDRADLISGHQLRRTALFSILYAGVCLVEGFGLYKEKTWAEYFTITLTVLALPWEFFELFRDPTAFRAGLLALNLLVLGYLLFVLRRMRRKQELRRTSVAS